MDQLPATAEPVQTEPKRRPIPKRVRNAITEIVEGRAKTITAAAKKVGLTRERLSRASSEPHRRASETKAALAVSIVAGVEPAPDNTSVNLDLSVRAGFVIDLWPDPRVPAKPGTRTQSGCGRSKSAET